MKMFNFNKLSRYCTAKCLSGALAENRVFVYGRVRREGTEQQWFKLFTVNFRYRSHRPAFIHGLSVNVQ